MSRILIPYSLPHIITGLRLSISEAWLVIVAGEMLSGGMKQRVAIARAFAINADMLLLDEPFGALDALTKGEMHLELLKLWNLDHRSKTILMVTHDIEEVIFLSDRIVVMSNGPAATIREIEELHLPRPRNKKDIVGLPEYKHTRERLLSLLMDKVEIGAADFYREAKSEVA